MIGGEALEGTWYPLVCLLIPKSRGCLLGYLGGKLNDSGRCLLVARNLSVGMIYLDSEQHDVGRGQKIWRKCTEGKSSLRIFSHRKAELAFFEENRLCIFVVPGRARVTGIETTVGSSLTHLIFGGPFVSYCSPQMSDTLFDRVLLGKSSSLSSGSVT